jgi:hypothetical protein
MCGRGRLACLTAGVKKSVDFGLDDHPDDDEERTRVAWAVAVVDDCEGCDDLRVEVTFEEVGRSATGLTTHLAPATARRLRAALGTALKEIGEDPGT